jgi:hypothetical protein
MDISFTGIELGNARLEFFLAIFQIVHPETCKDDVRDLLRAARDEEIFPPWALDNFEQEINEVVPISTIGTNNSKLPEYKKKWEEMCGI